MAPRQPSRSTKAKHKANRQSNLKQQNQSLQVGMQKLKGIVAVSIVANLVLVAGLGLMSMGKVEGGEVHVEGLPATLPPERFQGQTRETYEIAGEIPAILDATFCYCYCKTGHGHRSLLDCYVVEDAHAAICDVCQLEALRVKELWDDGMAIQDISDQIDDEFER